MGAIELRSVTVARGGDTVLEDVDLTVPDGQVVALLGHSGSGKTSLLRVIAGHDQVAAGRILLGGRDMTGRPPRERGLGMVAQGAPLQPDRDVEGNIRLPFELRGEDREMGRNRAWGQALRFGLQRLLGKRPSQLSAGQRSTTAMARSVVSGPQALLLDEPAAQLDPQTRAKVLQQIGIVQRTRGTTILAATNDLAVARALGDRIAVLGRGTLLQVGPPLQLRANPVTLDVADLVHAAPLASLTGHVVPGGTGRRTRVVTEAGDIPTWDTRVRDHGRPVLVGLAQEDLDIVAPRAGALTGTVGRVTTTGRQRLVTIETAAGDLTVAVGTRRPVADRGQPVGLEVHRALIATTDGDVLAVPERSS